MSTETGVKLSPLALTEGEVTSLLSNEGSSTLVYLTEKIAGAYATQSLKTADTMATEQIFRLLMRETELRVRVTLAEHVKNSMQLPRDIALSMARDVEEVALPMLQHSEVLTDHDLIELMDNTQEVTRYLAIAKRERVSSTVSDCLLEKGDDEVVSSLVDNVGATISNDGLEKIVAQYGDDETMMEAVGNRPYVPAAVIEKVIHKVSSSFADALKKKYHVAGEDLQKAQSIDSEIEKITEAETLKLIRVFHSQEDVDRLIGQLMAYNRLTPSIILSALCQGNFCFFETALARLANIPVNNSRSLINDRGELGFRALYNKSGLSESMFPAVRILLKTVRDLDAKHEKPGTSGFANRVVEGILDHAETEPVENLSYIIALVRQAAQ